MMQEQHIEEHSSATQTKTSERSCVVCREKGKASELLGLKVLNKILVVDEKVGGRGAYVHLTETCLAGLSAALVEKALRTEISMQDPKAWLSGLRLLAKKRIFECMGLARRAGSLEIGLEQIQRLRSKSKPGALLIFRAEDLAEGSVKKCGNDVHVFCSGQDLGKAVGREWAGVVGFGNVRHRKRAYYWWNLWQQLSFVA